MNTITEVTINGKLVDIKSKQAPQTLSGWSVIAFTPHCSIWCTRLHDKASVDAFVESIISATVADADIDSNVPDEVRKAILSIIDVK